MLEDACLSLWSKLPKFEIRGKMTACLRQWRSCCVSYSPCFTLFSIIFLIFYQDKKENLCMKLLLQYDNYLQL